MKKRIATVFAWSALLNLTAQPAIAGTIYMG
jgi:hypothetical protein